MSEQQDNQVLEITTNTRVKDLEQQLEATRSLLKMANDALKAHNANIGVVLGELFKITNAIDQNMAKQQQR